jgi:acetoin utilization deacetylase AcuC-like enzyme
MIRLGLAGLIVGELGGRAGAEIEPADQDAADKAQTTDGKSAAMRTGFVYDDIYLRHATPSGFPERPERLSAILEKLRKEKLLDQLVRPAYSPHGLKWISEIHSKGYVERVRTICRKGGGHIDSGDVPVCADSYEVAVAAVGGAMAAVDAVMQKEVRNAFCAIRPPGHHALRNKAMGFCIFNNVAVAARYVQKKYKLSKVLIVDWDVHHGNGTQAAFYEDPSVLYFSVHRCPFYPGTGAEKERGADRGLGFTVNAPLPAGSGDDEFRDALADKLLPAARAFGPDFVFISAGFDAHRDDPLGGMKVTAAGFAELTRMVKELAGWCCQGRIVSLLEGGYDLAGLANSVDAHVRALMS